MDLDEDGVITRSESETRMKHAVEDGKAKEDETEMFFKSADKNGDDQITFEEYKTLCAPPHANRTLCAVSASCR